MSHIGDEPTTPAIAWNGRNGALNGPNADDAAVGHQGTAAFGGSGPTIFPPGTRRFDGVDGPRTASTCQAGVIEDHQGRSHP